MMSREMTRLGNNLKRYRREAGLSRDKLAAASGVSFGYITKIEQGIAGMRIGNAKLQALANVLNVTIDQLAGTDEKDISVIADKERSEMEESWQRDWRKMTMEEREAAQEIVKVILRLWRKRPK